MGMLDFFLGHGRGSKGRIGKVDREKKAEKVALSRIGRDRAASRHTAATHERSMKPSSRLNIGPITCKLCLYCICE